MKNLFLFLLVLALSGTSLAQSPLQLARTSHDFGMIYEEHGKVSTSFSFYNAADTAVRIIGVEAGCGCTVPESTAEAIAPGDSSEITVSYNPVGRPGTFHKDITYTLAGPDSLQGTVNISGEVVPHPYPVEAGGLRFTSTTFDFGSLWHHQTDTAWLGIKNEQVLPYIIKHPIKVPAGMRLVQVPEQLAPGQEARLGLVWEVPASGHWGFAFAHLLLGIAPEGAEPEAVRLNLTAMVREDFTRTLAAGEAPAAALSVASLELGAVTAGEAHSRYTQLQNTGNAPLLIRAIKSSCSCLEVMPAAMELAPGASIPVELIYTPGEKVEGLQGLSVSFTVNDPAQPQLRLRLKAKVRPFGESRP